MKPHELILTSILDCRRVDLYTKKIVLSKELQERYDSMLQRYISGEPLQYVIGFTEFCGYRIYVNKHVLIPRPETEILVDTVCKTYKDRKDTFLKILDVGTGSGCISIALAQFFKNSRITALDVSHDALVVAQKNIGIHRLSARINCICEDMFSFLLNSAGEESFDIIVSNPPYIREVDMLELPGDVRQEPYVALDGGRDGLKYYRMVSSSVEPVMKPGARLFLEVGDGQAQDVESLFRGKEEFLAPKIINDYMQTERVISLQKRKEHGIS
jgi:protein-(glutamine-N5) methyltransferase, release factor-specific